MKNSAIAHPNIALVKYWGKKDEDLIIPYNNSISITLSNLYTHTTVEFSKKYSEDVFILNNKRLKPESKNYKKYIGRFLEIVRTMTKEENRVKIVSENNFPTSSGLASSASGFAALSYCINKCLNLNLNKEGLSMLARRGSGSASRSIHSGFVEWRKGEEEDGSDSYTVQIKDENHWKDLRIIICVTSSEKKKIKSREGMRRTVNTSPYYSNWLDTVNNDLTRVKKSIIDKNFNLLGRTAELNCLKMHATALTSTPPLIYWNSDTVKIMNAVMEWREQGLRAYYTIDAGPQVKILCLEEELEEIIERIEGLNLEDYFITKPGRGVRLTNEHLF